MADTGCYLILGLPAFFNRAAAQFICKLWGRNFIFAARSFHRINYHITGKLSPVSAIYASKHQSMWETFLLNSILDKPLFILKKELVTIPVFGRILAKAGHIVIDRKNPVNALRPMGAAVKKALAIDRNVVIFPEGTRTLPSQQVQYKPGIAILYSSLTEISIIPIALNSGVY